MVILKTRKNNCSHAQPSAWPESGLWQWFYGSSRTVAADLPTAPPTNHGNLCQCGGLNGASSKLEPISMTQVFSIRFPSGCDLVPIPSWSDPDPVRFRSSSDLTSIRYRPLLARIPEESECACFWLSCIFRPNLVNRDLVLPTRTKSALSPEWLPTPGYGACPIL